MGRKKKSIEETHHECISFSGGRTSALMTLEYLKKNPEAVVIFANTGKEREGTLEFVHNVDQLLGGRIVWVEYIPVMPGYRIVSYETASRNGEPFAALIKRRKYLPNRVTRFCTQELKIRPMKKYCKMGLGWRHWTNIVGIRYDEPARWDKKDNVSRKEIFEVAHPLVEWKITKPDVLAYWKKMPFDLNLHENPILAEVLGNCDGCFLKGKKKKQMIARHDPSIFDWWKQQEQETGSTFHPDYSYSMLIKHLNRAPELDFDDSINCFCNTD